MTKPPKGVIDNAGRQSYHRLTKPFLTSSSSPSHPMAHRHCRAILDLIVIAKPPSTSSSSPSQDILDLFVIASPSHPRRRHRRAILWLVVIAEPRGSILNLVVIAESSSTSSSSPILDLIDTAEPLSTSLSSLSQATLDVVVIAEPSLTSSSSPSHLRPHRHRRAILDLIAEPSHPQRRRHRLAKPSSTSSSSPSHP